MSKFLRFVHVAATLLVWAIVLATAVWAGLEPDFARSAGIMWLVTTPLALLGIAVLLAPVR